MDVFVGNRDVIPSKILNRKELALLARLDAVNSIQGVEYCRTHSGNSGAAETWKDRYSIRNVNGCEKKVACCLRKR